MTLSMMRDGAKLPEWREYVGEGWHPILDRLHERLEAVDPGYLAGTVKEKFGGLRVYLNTTWSPEAEAAIGEAAAESLRTCEECGAPGRRRGRSERASTWVKTYCDAHAREHGYTD